MVHTPAPLARFVARATQSALGELGRTLASDDVVVVDPATGPGVFLGAVLEEGSPEEAARRDAAGRSAPRALLGLDVDEGAIDRARTALEEPARDRGWPLALAHADALASLAPHPLLADDDVVRVVIGNPPWAGRSANREARVTADLLEDFRRDARGEPLGERKIGVLSDDYVRFVRWSCELVRRARRGGVIALVTNASYLDGPVHRGMRAAMRRWMDRVEVFDLGGSSLVARRAVAPGERDENVFGVRPGVAIVVATRRPGPEPRAGELRVARVRGSRASKIAWLGSAAPTIAGPGEVGDERAERPWIAATRATPAAYFSWPSLASWMPFHREGVQTNRDELVIARDRASLIDRLEQFASGTIAPPSTPHWSAERARAVARALLGDRTELDRHLRTIAYRPLDDRIALLHPALCHRPRPELARAIDASSLVLITARKDRGDRPWACFGATRLLPDNCWLSTRSSCRARAFPTHAPDGAPNLDPAAFGALDPERFVGWALAWMACTIVRVACDDALHADFPRIPVPHDSAELAEVAAAGAALAQALGDPRIAGDPGLSGGVPETAAVGHHTLGPGRRAGAVAAALEAIDRIVGSRARSRLSASPPSG